MKVQLLQNCCATVARNIYTTPAQLNSTQLLSRASKQHVVARSHDS